jgi:hypothetical protein
VIAAAKHLDLETCVLNVSAVILERIFTEGAATLEDLLTLVEKELGYDARFNVVPALGFLYLLDSVRYIPEQDVIAYKLAAGGGSEG